MQTLKVPPEKGACFLLFPQEASNNKRRENRIALQLIDEINAYTRITKLSGYQVTSYFCFSAEQYLLQSVSIYVLIGA
ncbi:hypothetical protein N8079_01850 [Crocinitomicaceae bacterium]|nr:hypothetical protein [Crocinitomicaceae bacterium]MDG1347775.1 hypothetical protein [Crocinitomicaceae bacterium]MDG2465452.1 hypothetical protein [Crocinitomicaceae bacterium]